MAFKRNHINRRVLNDLMKRSTVGVIFYLILTTLIISLDNFYSRNKLLSQVFFSSVCIICGIRYLHVVLFKTIESKNPILNIIVFRVTVGLTALIWGIAFAVFMTFQENFNVRLIMAMASTGLCSGGSVAFLPDRNLSYAYNALIILPAGFALIILGENRPLGFMIFLYFFYLFLISTRGNKEYWNAMENDFNLREKTGILENLSRTDVLTGLYNRRHFDEVLGSEWKRASRDQKSFSMAIGDIDHFKIINDNHGHLAGDEYLKYVAGAFKEIFKRESDFVARYGGEEFVVLLPDTNSTRAFELTEILRKKMEKGSIKFNRFDIKATISFGVASVVPNYTDSSTTLISRADAALYKAKMNGRNRIEVA